MSLLPRVRPPSKLASTFIPPATLLVSAHACTHHTGPQAPHAIPRSTSFPAPDWYNDDTGAGSPAYGLTKQYTCVQCQPQVGAAMCRMVACALSVPAARHNAVSVQRAACRPQLRANEHAAEQRTQ